MKPIQRTMIVFLVTSWLVSGCAGGVSTQFPISPVQHLETTPQPTIPTATALPTSSLSPDALASLQTLKQVDDYPLYTMHYVGEYVFEQPLTQPMVQPVEGYIPQRISSSGVGVTSWGCALFATLSSEGDNKLYGRNFDWESSPALLLFTSPPDGYASVSIVDIAFLGFTGNEAQGLTALPSEQLQSLLRAPAWPFDGMNSHGLTIGMAAVPDGNILPDPDKPTLDSLMVMREILDHAADVAQALEIFSRYNIEMGGGPPLHYLVADVTGEAALVEFYQGEMYIIRNQEPYHLATNFLLSAVDDSPAGQCWRYDTIQETLSTKQGGLLEMEAIQLLARVAQESTQWSVVYDMTSLEVRVVVGQHYEQVHWFELK